MAIDFPASPTTGQTFTSGTVTYTWDGTKWTAVTGSVLLDKIEEGNTSAEVIDTGSDGRFVVTTEGTEALRVDSSGRLGLGTSSPRGAVHIGADLAGGATDAAAINIKQTSTTKDTGIYLERSGDQRGHYIYISSANDALTFERNNIGTSSVTMSLDRNGDVGIGRAPTGSLDVYRASGSNRVKIDSDSLSNLQLSALEVSGGVGAATLGVYKHSGITNPTGYIALKAQDGAVPYFWVDNSDQFRLSTSNSHIGTTSGTVVGTQTSDERIKNILGPVEYGLDTLKQIEPVRYALKSEPSTEKLGFIAQQVRPLVPQSVFDTGEHIEGEPEDAPTKLGMEYVALIPVLVNAIKELSAEVDALKAQLQAS